MSGVWRARLLLAAQLVLVAVVAVYVVAQSYEGRVDIRTNSLRACERAKVDRVVNAQGWRTAEAARRASGTRIDLVAAARYDRIASSLEARSRIDCAIAFPAPTLAP